MWGKILTILQEFLFLFSEISILFILVSMLVAFVNEKYSKFFETHLKSDGFGSYIKAIFLGALTPFCSCSSIPLLNAFLRSGVPLGVCIAYLSTSPLINPIILVMFIASFGVKITLFYVGFLFGIILLLAFGISKTNTRVFFNENFLNNELQEGQTNSCCSSVKSQPTTQTSCCSSSKITQLATQTSCCSSNNSSLKFKKYESRLKKYFTQSLKEYKKILPYIIIGMAIGATIHGAFPQNFFEEYLKDYGILGVIIAAFIGVLLYMNCSAMIPVALSLTQAGVPLGIMMSFLIAGAGCSLPELILLKRIFKTSFLILFAGMIVAIAISFGLLIFFT
ncbi:arsenic resistance permease [Campylobacter lari]|uniref:arsenic resistance permease n=1 Tax=Campylobacter lari TaxID=201 RepID=UPI0005802427|nr:arsenic resistance permease [Campylobacter lari]AJC89089.1 arsenic resistance permease [Campylobacter lari subsp. concheus LMG 11760]EAI4304880.1 arsenic resistance permease [Campylobacter lari]EAI5560064.1 arsenic resistance permease [Campylobacter lari]EAJ0360000.1 arsenic resistance permease [Campylobacter lari]EAJ1269529.1 arsenic resistance permease [Campylobacter lari]